MTDYIWSHLLYTNSDGPHYILVQVLAWHGDTATVLELGDDGSGFQTSVVGATPYTVRIADLRFGHLPLKKGMVAA